VLAPEILEQHGTTTIPNSFFVSHLLSFILLFSFHKCRYVSDPSHKVLERIDRALTQRLYLVNQEEVVSTNDDEGLARSYAVLGSTNNVYDIHVGKIPTCSCPDFEKGHLCKHILFVMLKVLRVPQNSPLIYQKALLQSELQSIFAAAPPIPSHGVVASNVIVSAYQHATGKSPGKGKSSSEAIDVDVEEESKEETDLTDEEECDCPICFEAMPLKVTEALERCCTCKKRIHKDCIEHWFKHSKNCPMCRGPWLSAATILKRGLEKRGGGGGADGGRYINISASGNVSAAAEVDVLDDDNDYDDYRHRYRRRRGRYDW